MTRDLCQSTSDIHYITLCFYIGSLQNFVEISLWKQMQQTLLLKRFMWVEEIEVIIEHDHLACEFTMWNYFVIEPMTQVKFELPYKICRVFSMVRVFCSCHYQVDCVLWSLCRSIRNMHDSTMCYNLHGTCTHLCKFSYVKPNAIWTLFSWRFMWVIVVHHHPTCVRLYNANGYVTKLVTQT